MTIAFNQVPAALRVPGAYIEIDGSMAGLNSGAQPNMLLVGQKLAAGSAVANTIVLANGLADVVAKAGAGSMLAQMAARFYAINPAMMLYLLPMADNGAGAAATATLTVTTPPTAAGTLQL